jgi:nitrogen fixation NifU-like protein
MIDRGELRELYQELILDHGRNPRNHGVPVQANRVAEGHNPLCGDRVTVSVSVSDEGVIEDIGFTGAGCAISTAAASTMTEAVKGKTVVEAKRIFERFREFVAGSGTKVDMDGLEKLAAFGGVTEFPMRVKCATLSWHTLEAALERKDEQVTTE